MCKGSCRRKPTEGLFFLQHSNRCAVSEPVSATPASVLRTLANPPTAARFPNPSPRGLQVCFAHSQIPPTAARFPNPSRRGLQACFAHSQIPLHKGAFLSIVLLFDFLSYLLSQKSPPVRRAFCFFILRLLWFLQQAFLREFLRISLKQPHSL